MERRRQFWKLKNWVKNHEGVKMKLLKAYEGLDSSRSLLVSRGKKPKLVFVMKTKIKSSKFTSFKNSLLGFEGCFSDDLIGRGGGLGLLWNDEVELIYITFPKITLVFG